MTAPAPPPACSQEPSSQTATPLEKPGPSRKAIIGWTAGMLAVLGMAWFVGTVVVPVWQTHRVLSKQWPALLTAEKSPWGKTRWELGEKEAISLLGGRDQAVPRLLLYARMPRRIAPYRVEALFLLFRCAGKDAIPALSRHLQDADPLVREQAAWALRKLGTAARPAVPALIKALEDKSAKVRGLAAGALGAIGAEARGAVPGLEALRGDKQVYVNCVDSGTMPIRVETIATGALKRIRAAQEKK
jgi:HEAT repeats